MEIQHLVNNNSQADGELPHILIVDDAPVSLAILNRVLSKHYTVLQAENGREAMEILRQGGVSVVLTDVQMPEMSGLELLKAMRQDAELCLIPVMMITADGNSENETEALELGAMDVIRKPFVPQILLSRVRNLIALQAAYQTAEKNRQNERQLAEQTEMLRAVECDELTGVLTRQAFYRHVMSYLEEHPAQTLEMLRFDMDNFSIVNDLMGVKAGDRLLREIGKKLIAYSKLTAGIPVIGHIEADHFAVLHDPSIQSAEEFYRYIQNWLTEDEGEYHLNCRLGIYTITDASLEPTVMCDRALMALRSTKGNFTKRFAWYDESMRKKLLEEQELTAEMLPALQSGQFVVYYQPQINYSSGELVGAEALVRWNHPKRGLLPPSVFLPLFEHNGQITQLDAFVWESVCRQIKVWKNKFGEKLTPISVNVSRVDMYGIDLCSRLTELVKKYQIPTELFRLEITESAYVGDAQRLCGIVEQLSMSGFQIEMDDFGSAYSSLNMLKDIPVDILKLDMKFLSETKNSARSGNILSSVVRMARWLQLPIIAEGVETKTQADYLCSIGCLYMQGYYFSKPIPAEQYEAYLVKREPGRTDKYRNTDISAAEHFWDASTQTALIFNSYVGGAVILQRTGDALEMLRANDEFFRVVHISREDYMPSLLNVWQRFSSEYQKIYGEMLDKASKGEPGAECDICSLPLAGHTSDWTRNKARLLAQNGPSEIFYVSVENITAEKTAQKELAQQKEQLSKLYNGVPCGIMDFLISDEKPQMVNFNDTTWKMLGYPDSAAFARNYIQNGGRAMVHPNDLPQMTAKVREALSLGSYTVGECRVERADHSYFWAEIRLQCYIDHGDFSLQCIFMDISDRREREMQKYGRMLLSIFDEVFLWDYQSDTTQTLKGTAPYSHDGEILSGLREIQKNWASCYVAPKDREALLSFLELGAMRKACAQQKVPYLDYLVSMPDGTNATARVSAFPIDENRFLFCSRNITQEKQAAEQANRIAVLQATLDDRERYRIIIEQTGVAIIEWNHMTNEFYHSGSYEKYAISRCNPNDVINNRASTSVICKDDIPVLGEFFKDIKSGKGGAESVLRLRMTDGSYRWTRMRCDMLLDAEGKRARTIGTFTDVDNEMRAKETLRETNAKLEKIIANIPSGVGIYRFEASGELVPIYISDRTCQIFGFTREEYDACAVSDSSDVFMPDMGKILKSHMESAKQDDTVFIPKIRCLKKDGSAFWLRLNCSFTSNEQGETLCYATMMDVSHLVEAEQAADSVNELYQLLVESTETIMLDYSVASDLLQLSFLSNEGERREKQYPSYMTYLESGKSHVAPSSRPELLKILRSAISRERHGELDVQALGLDRRQHWYHIKYSCLSEEGSVYRIIGRADNLDGVLRSQERKLERAQLDRVTGLRNKDSGRAAVEGLLQQRPEGQLDAMLFIDIDDFKAINDSLGHLEADRILARVGAIIKKNFRSTDITSRFGGDEFLVYIVAPENREIVLKKANVLLEAFQAIPTENGHYLGCSIGVVEVSGNMRKFDSVFRCADKMMYHSKQSGKQQISVYPAD